MESQAVPVNWKGRSDRTMDWLLPADAANERHAVRVGPDAKLVELVVIDQEMLGTTRANDRLLAISPGFAPFEHTAVGVAIAFAQMLDDGADMRTEGLIRPYPGSVLTMEHLRTS